MNDRFSTPDAVGQVRFCLGQIVATPAALRLLEAHGLTAHPFLTRHARGDWGDVPADDAIANDEALIADGRLLSAYAIGNGRIWVITEADRSSSCVLLPQEY